LIDIVRARNAVATVFILAGLAMASWLSRIPQVRDLLELSAGELGRVLLAMAVGSVIALPTAALVVNRLGAARAVAGGALASGCGLSLVGSGAGLLASVPAVMTGLFALGYGFALWDVSMNVEGAAVERRLGRSIMPRLHAGFSLGTVAGAGLGALAAAVGLPVVWHIGVVAALVIGVAALASRSFLPAAGTDPRQPADPRGRRFRTWHAWREPRTVLVGVLVLAFALSEGIASDWLAVGLIDGFGVSHATGAIGLGVFVSAMTVGRTLGTQVIDRYGRVRVLRVSAVLGAAGVLLVVLPTAPPVAFAGAVVWGLGTALGFPVGMSAGADDPRRAAVRVSVVASIAYTAFLAGPPLLGALGDQIGVQRALLVAAGALAVGAAVASATRPLSVPAAEPATAAARG
jgi:fucose permease